MSRYQITVTILHAGQPRAYADSLYEADITGQNWWDSTSGERPGTWEISEAQAKSVAQAFVCPFSEAAEPHALETQLTSLTKIPGGWKVRIVQPYCD